MTNIKDTLPPLVGVAHRNKDNLAVILKAAEDNYKRAIYALNSNRTTEKEKIQILSHYRLGVGLCNHINSISIHDGNAIYNQYARSVDLMVHGYYSKFPKYPLSFNQINKWGKPKFTKRYIINCLYKRIELIDKLRVFYKLKGELW